MDKTQIKSMYLDVIQYESIGRNWRHTIFEVDAIYGISVQLLEIASSALIPRKYNSRYHLADSRFAYESISAHTNLMTTLLDRVLCMRYGVYLNGNLDGFSYRQIMEAARRHDLPETIVYETPRGSVRSGIIFARDEHSYWQAFAKSSPDYDSQLEEKVSELLKDMELRRNEGGKMLYLANKISAIIAVLAYDMVKLPPVKIANDPNNSLVEDSAIKICDTKDSECCKASEIWTIAYFKLRNIIQYDDSGFFTAILVMTTLIANKKWYRWREIDYKK